MRREVPDSMVHLRLAVRSCRVVGSGDVVETHHTVQCPKRQRSASFALCCGCTSLGSIDVDADAKHGAVDCLLGEHPLPHGRVDVAEAAVRVRLGDIMGVDTTCVRSDVKIAAVADLLLDEGLRAVPVVDEARRLVGIVSKTDLLRPRGSASGKKRAKVVADIMTPVVHGLPEDAPVAYAISLMAFEALHEVPVVDRDSHVIGMITATDALRWVAQALGYVHQSGRAPAPATGKDGIVVQHGHIASKSANHAKTDATEVHAAQMKQSAPKESFTRSAAKASRVRGGGA